MKDYPYPMQARNEALCPFTRDTQLSGFLTLPKSLLCWGLSPGALLVYGLLLDRGKLSQRSGWTDKQGWVYVIFPVRELALALGKGVTTIKRWLRELEERELIFRTVPFQGEAGWIFLLRGGGGAGEGPGPAAPRPRCPGPLGGAGLGAPGGRAGPHRRRWPDAGGAGAERRAVFHSPVRFRPRVVSGHPRSNSGRGRGRIWAISKIISQSKSQSNPIMGGGGKGRFPPPWFGWGRWGFSPAPLERRGTGACPAGAPFLGKKWGKEPPGEEVPPPGPPSLVGLCGGRLYVSLVTWPAALTVKGP